ncbi:cation:proton antiporter [Agaribacterium haliotis]|uniref:cation:proton antiporter domain-containing protein n=1 Tax=Agaribacterium haliotis TaxID=2013869 RepID=UPI000BB54664|nr:cation:proton antiporter [Agaribacterium haliotis]
MEGHLFDTFFLIFCGAAIAATLALYTRQPLFLAYIGLGVILGPHAIGLIGDVKVVSEMSHIGIIFLLFLLGLDMQPKALASVLKKATHIAILSCAAFALIGFGIAIAFGFNFTEALVFAMAAMFSSTIIGIKLLPTTVLHHRHTGDMMVGLLLLQDFIAIFCLLILLCGSAQDFEFKPLIMALLALPALAAAAFYFVKYVLLKLIEKHDRIHEFIFLVAIGWCLGLAAIAEYCYLSAEIGAFIAGISLATSPISQYIALNLKPLRDFFLILFFFALGAQLNIALLPDVAAVTLCLAFALLIAKPLVFYALLRHHSERKSLAWDISFRLGQISEFSLLITLLASQQGMISERASVVIQSAAIITFIVSSYIVILNFPNPIAVKESLRRD